MTQRRAHRHRPRSRVSCSRSSASSCVAGEYPSAEPPRPFPYFRRKRPRGNPWRVRLVGGASGIRTRGRLSKPPVKHRKGSFFPLEHEPHPTRSPRLTGTSPIRVAALVDGTQGPSAQEMILAPLADSSPITRCRVRSIPRMCRPDP